MSLQMHAHIDPHTDPKLAVRDANVSMISSRLSRTPAYGRRLKHRQFWRVALSPRPRWQMKGEKNRTVQLVKIRMRHVISAFLCGCCNCGNCTIADINVVSLRQRKISAKINTPMSRSSWHDHVHKKKKFKGQLRIESVNAADAHSFAEKHSAPIQRNVQTRPLCGAHQTLAGV